MLSDHDIFQHYQAKATEFTKPSDISLIGHSLFDMWDNFPEGTPHLAGKTVANLGISGISTRQYLEVIVQQNLIKTLGKEVFIFLGVNDICKEIDYSPAKVIAWLSDMLTAFRNISPNSRYFLLEATPVNNISTTTNSQIHTLNAYMQTHCPKNVIYIPTHHLFCDEHNELDPLLSTDGLHFNEQGYQQLTQILEQALTKTI